MSSYLDRLQQKRVLADEYQQKRKRYEELASEISAILNKSFSSQGLRVADITFRAKSVDSFVQKAMLFLPGDVQLKYEHPFQEITDLAGVRVITFFLQDVKLVDGIIDSEFEVIEKSDKTDLLIKKDTFGYQSVHYLVRMKPSRTGLTEYKNLVNMTTEIQVRTILQHAWAEIEHDIQYKSHSVETIPNSIRRRFMTLAGLLEIGDKEFQAIHDDYEVIEIEAQHSVEKGEFDAVEITPDSVKAYLDKKYKPDGRLSLDSYGYLAALLRSIGFTNFQEIEDKIKDLDEERLNEVAFGAPQGQIKRFETLLLVAIGDPYLENHPSFAQKGFKVRMKRALDNLSRAGYKLNIKIQ